MLEFAHLPRRKQSGRNNKLLMHGFRNEAILCETPVKMVFLVLDRARVLRTLAHSSCKSFDSVYDHAHLDAQEMSQRRGWWGFEVADLSLSTDRNTIANQE